MIKILNGASESTIAVEIIDGYEVSDEKALERLFEDILASGVKKVNFVAKIDKLNLNDSSWKATWNDGIYALKHLKNCGRIAIVGHSKVEAFFVNIDSAFYNSKKADRMEKYFDVADLDKAIGWVNE